MANSVKLFFIKIRQNLFVRRLDREIYHCVLPHLKLESDFGYPFSSNYELQKKLLEGRSEVSAHLHVIQTEANNMGKAYGDAFRYIMYRDINRRLKKYRRFMRKRSCQFSSHLRVIATHT